MALTAARRAVARLTLPEIDYGRLVASPASAVINEIDRRAATRAEIQILSVELDDVRAELTQGMAACVKAGCRFAQTLYRRLRMPMVAWSMRRRLVRPLMRSPSVIRTAVSSPAGRSPWQNGQRDGPDGLVMSAWRGSANRRAELATSLYAIDPFRYGS
ncbi:hypothetical protein ACFQGX_00530 [Nonomuraea dietziae]